MRLRLLHLCLPEKRDPSNRSVKKRVILISAGTALVMIGAALILFPLVGNYLLYSSQQAEISGWREHADSLSDAAVSRELAAARAYNESLSGSAVISDPFGAQKATALSGEYNSLLNIRGDGMMGYIEIPCIDVSLPVYHGTDDKTLDNGIGHLQMTSLPIGGKGTHSVLTGHAGVSSAKLFSDLDLLREGDVFYVHSLGNTLMYEIDQVKVVLPDNIRELRIEPDEDYCTLVTCTPYGINSHRLLVRGRRVPYSEPSEKDIDHKEQTHESTWVSEYLRALIIGGGAMALWIVLILLIRRVVVKKKQRGEKQ